MSIWFVSRHQGAIDWMKRQENWSVDHWVAHLSIDDIKKGDTVIGVLPIALAAQVCAKNGLFYALVIPQTLEQRGKEHSADTLNEVKCQLIRYDLKEMIE